MLAYPISLFNVDYGNFYLKAVIYAGSLAEFPIKGKDMKNEYKNIDDCDF